MAETKKDALLAFDAFIETWGVKYDRATECLIKDRDALLAFHDFPAEHWKHLRTTNVIESTFATVRHRTVRSKGCLSNKTALAMIFKLAEAAEKSWRRLDGHVIQYRGAHALSGVVEQGNFHAKISIVFGIRGKAHDALFLHTGNFTCAANHGIKAHDLRRVDDRSATG
jgi:Transposase, Mutator family